MRKRLDKNSNCLASLAVLLAGCLISPEQKVASLAPCGSCVKIGAPEEPN